MKLLPKKHARRGLLLVLAASLLVTGCARKNILEDLGLVLAIGYDLDDSGRMMLTAAMPEVSNEADERVQVITSKGDMSKEARENISLSTDRQMVSGQLRTAIYSEKLARQGIWRALDTMLRDVNITSSLVICISDGEAREILKEPYPDRPQVGRYLHEMLRKEGRNYTIPKTTLHDFSRLYHSAGADPFAPYLQMKGGYAHAAGTALFRKDKFVGSLSPEETKMLLLLEGQGQGGDIKQALPKLRKDDKEPDQIMLTFVRTKYSSKIITHPDKPPKITYTVKVAGQVIEYTGDLDLTQEANKQKIIKVIEKGLGTRMKDLLQQLQHKYKVDPLGIGERIRATGVYKPWNEQKWRELYEGAEIDVKFDLSIIRTGMTK